MNMNTLFHAAFSQRFERSAGKWDKSSRRADLVEILYPYDRVASTADKFMLSLMYSWYFGGIYSKISHIFVGVSVWVNFAYWKYKRFNKPKVIQL